MAYNLQSPLVKVYHNDMKPSNVLTEQRVNIIVSDFGSSLENQISNNRPTVLINTNIGITEGYCAPEIINSLVS